MTATDAGRTLSVDLAERSYPIHIGPGLLAQGDLIARHLPHPKAVIITNTVVAPLYLETLSKALVEQQISVQSIILPDGENHKDWQTLNRVFDALLAHRAERYSSSLS